MSRRELRLIRDALDSVLSPALAASTLEDAIERMGGPPETPGEVMTLLNGPLRVALERTHGAAADDVIDDLLQLLTPRADPAAPVSEVTRELPIETAQVFVFVLSSSEALGREIEDALGSDRVMALTYEEPERLEKALAFRPPSIVIIDGASFPMIEPSRLPQLLASLPETTVRAIWGIDTPFGSAALSELAHQRGSFTPLDRREGIAPVLDLIRARRFVV